jgi:hypothetical protein
MEGESMYRRLLAGILFVLVSPMAFAASQFDAVVPAIAAFRNDPTKVISIHVTTTSFEVRRRVETSLASKDAEARLPKDALPQLKISDGGNSFEYPLPDEVIIARPITANGENDAARQWKQYSWSSVGTFQRNDWSAFIEFALTNGLVGVTQGRFNGTSELTLTFAPVTPRNLAAGPRRLELSEAFRSVMRVSSQYPAKTGTRGFVILLHDPHQSIPGRFQTLLGLRALSSANPSVPFQFLIEGAYQGPSRELGLSGLDALIPAGQTGAVVVNRLLSRFMINTPTAYRLLYDRTIPAWAIDDNNLLAYPAPRSLRPVKDQFASLQRVAAAVEKSALPATVKSSLQEALVIAIVYLETDVSDAPDSALADYYGTLQKIFAVFAGTAKEMSAAGVTVSAADISGFTADSLAFGDEFNSYSKALGRNKTMAPQIIEKAAGAGGRMPIAFIGNYHTRGIVEALQKASVGYVVIEPRLNESITVAEARAFDRVNYGNTRTNYLANTTLNMGWNLPTPAEVSTYFKPKLAATTRTVEAARAAIVAKLQGQADSAIRADKLLNAMSDNGSLGAIAVSAGGNTPPPPGKFGGAFAYFDPGEGPRGRGPTSDAGPRLVITNAADARWKENDRYELLQVATFLKSQRPTTESVTSDLSVYAVAGSTRPFVVTYDARSKRTYCLEGTPQLVASLVPLPTGDPNKSLNLRAQVAELLIRRQRAHRG